MHRYAWKQRQWKCSKHKHKTKLNCNMTAVEKNIKSPAETNQAKHTKQIDQKPVWQHWHVLQCTVNRWEKVWILLDGLKVGQKCKLCWPAIRKYTTERSTSIKHNVLFWSLSPHIGFCPLAFFPSFFVLCHRLEFVPWVKLSHSKGALQS